MARHDAPDRTMPQGSKQKMGQTSVHKAPGRSQLSKTDTGSLERNSPTGTRPIGRRPHTARHDAPERTSMPQGSKQQTSRPNVHKAPQRLELSKTNTGTLERNGPTQMRPIERPYTTRQYCAPERTMLQGRKRKMGCPNVHKGPG